VWELKLINLESGAFQEPPPEHWRLVADRIQLPPQMRESALACYSLFLEYVERVKAERREVLSDFAALERQLAERQLAAAEAAAGATRERGGAGAASSAPAAPAAAAALAAAAACGAPATLQFRVDGYEGYQALLDRLTLSLKREHLVSNMLGYSLAQIASHVQMAKGMLACWPYWPDGPSVLAIWLQDEQLQAMRARAYSQAGGAAPGTGGTGAGAAAGRVVG
jgi:hypothetical protein